MTTKEKVKVFVECGIPQTKIADIAQIDRSTLSKWYRGDRENISAETETQIEVALASIVDMLNNAVYGESGSPFEIDEIILD